MDRVSFLKNKNINMKNIFLIILLLVVSVLCFSQPYFDLVNTKYTISPDAGILNRQKTSNHLSNVTCGVNLPFVLKKDSTTLVISPAFESWNISIDSIQGIPGSITSLVLPFSIIKPVSQKWIVLFSIIPRWNGYNSQLVVKNNFQLGLAGLASYKKRQGLVYKFGIYYNSEFSGTFIMPLLGIDWKINERNNLFGVLPGSVTYEHKVNNRFYWGSTFKAITNSYQAGFYNFTSNTKFIRVDDNQFSFFADGYLTRYLVVTIEAGHSVSRQLRLGTEHSGTKYYYKEKMRDDFLFKAGVAYRLRFR